MFIPDALARHRSGFLAAMSDARATQTLQEGWQKFGAGVLPASALMPPSGLSVSGFQHDKHLCFLILFPPPKAAGESHFGLLVAGPSDDWSPEARAKVPVRYFLLERSASDAPTIFEWRASGTQDEEIFNSHGSGPSPQNPPEFVEAILSRFYGLKPDAKPCGAANGGGPSGLPSVRLVATVAELGSLGDMTAEALIQEGRALMRPSIFLRKEPSGPVAARWYPMDYDDYNRTRVRRWLTVDSRFIPGFSAHEQTYLTVFSHEGRADDGRVEVTKSWPEQGGIALYAYPVSVLPPIHAVFAYGSPAIDQWLSTHGSKRTDNFLESLDDEAIRGYEEVWQRESPYFASDISAVLGGWHMAWPEGDFNALLGEQLLIWTLEEPEPWVEAWQTAAGDFKVRQRIT